MVGNTDEHMYKSLLGLLWFLTNPVKAVPTNQGCPSPTGSVQAWRVVFLCLFQGMNETMTETEEKSSLRAYTGAGEDSSTIFLPSQSSVTQPHPAFLLDSCHHQLAVTETTGHDH